LTLQYHHDSFNGATVSMARWVMTAILCARQAKGYALNLNWMQPQKMVDYSMFFMTP